MHKNAHESVFEALEGTPLQRRHAHMYLNTLAVGHLPFVNKLISAYRRAAYDPFAQSVTEASVPAWFVRQGDQFMPVSVYPYFSSEERPSIDTSKGTVDLDLATKEEVEEFLGREESPAESILLDAWSYYYAGRFSDSIRALVTAVEVLLEAKYVDELKRKGKTAEEIEGILCKNANRFLTRLSEYTKLAERTIPGPQLSAIHYVNGVRLRQELIRTRELRHKIVHGGHQIEPHAYGSMQRSLETITGFFSWLDGNPEDGGRRFRAYSLKSGLRGRVPLSVEFLTEGVNVVEWFLPKAAPLESLMLDQILWRDYEAYQFGDRIDIPLFVKMSLAFLIQESTDIVEALHEYQNDNAMDEDKVIEDYGLSTAGPNVISETYRCGFTGFPTPIFIIELDSLIETNDLTGVMLRLLQLRVELAKRVHGVCVVVQQRNLNPIDREEALTVDDSLNDLLLSCDLSLVLAPQLSRYVTGATIHGWSLKTLKDSVSKPGYAACLPPDSTCVGTILKIFPRPKVLGIDVFEQISEGDRLYVRADRGYAVMNVKSIEQDGRKLKTVNKGETGVGIEDITNVVEGSHVFRINGAK